MFSKISILALFVGFLLLSLAVLPKAQVQAKDVQQAATATRTNTPIGPTRTPTSTPVASECSPVDEIIRALPYYKDGTGTFCLRLPTTKKPLMYMNSWNLTSLTVNGSDFTNVYVPVASLPAKISGYWYIHYVSSSIVGHFEAN